MNKKKNIQSLRFRSGKKEDCEGFTLLELLISIVIMSIIISIMFGALRLGIKVWEKGEADAGIGHRIRVVSRQIKSQIASICTENILDDQLGSGVSPFFLKGSDTSISFVTRYPISPDSRCSIVYATYYSKGSGDSESLMMFEKDVCIITDEALADIQNADNEDAGHILVQGIKEVAFEYLGKNMDGGADWKDSWNMGVSQEKSFPMAVKISFFFDKRPVSIIAGIMADREKEK